MSDPVVDSVVVEPPVVQEPLVEDPVVDTTDVVAVAAALTRDAIIKSTWSHYVIIGASIFAIVWGYFNVIRVSALILQLLECLIGNDYRLEESNSMPLTSRLTLRRPRTRMASTSPPPLKPARSACFSSTASLPR